MKNCEGFQISFPTKTEVGPLLGAAMTFFHWTHNQRVYIGFMPWRRWIWVPQIAMLPYPLWKSIKLMAKPRG